MVLEREEERYVNVTVSSIQWSDLIWWILHCTVHMKYGHLRKMSHFSVRGFKCYPSLLHNIYILCEKPPSWEFKGNVSNIQFICSLCSLQDGWFKVCSIVCSMYIYIVLAVITSPAWLLQQEQRKWENSCIESIYCWQK